MTPIAPLITGFLRDYLPNQRGFSPHSCDAYARSFTLLLTFVSTRLRVRPAQLMLEQIDADMVIAFLTNIERERGNSASTRNLRLAAIKTFMRYVELKYPRALEQIAQIRAIPGKRHEQKLVQHLTLIEIRAVLDAPDLKTRAGIRDRAMLHLCFAGGLRVSELVGVRLEDVVLHPTPSVTVLGKGRRERCLPLWKDTARDIRAWLAVRGTPPTPELFTNAQGRTMTRADFEYVLEKHAASAASQCPTLSDRLITPHLLRHSCAVTMLQATRDIRKVALWLGHADIRTTEVYLRIDPSEKLEAIEAVLPPSLRRGRFKAPDALIASLMAHRGA
ncbi:tyrosine-type recombinase/integrase [Acidomonas methanolica]|uniref:Phage integrase n=1 Tax=Acidomonas methanolica NBRC 104435 TaxID=1231351 RepID=A0A023D9B9_ACIMT|nr:tyrosine-type recombinase/integrase [Acidomonas methanolica]TCS16140.1 site-specific recombinase XerD [Acidomonas methanolica]GAJ30747.1 phage integrase [Acidomonas methanolica NBRC 104435]GBQ49304.1 integrase [Acidomonas methanolica]GEL00788.1 integrase [Acidomonas methanolica NBRC 104435]